MKNKFTKSIFFLAMIAFIACNDDTTVVNGGGGGGGNGGGDDTKEVMSFVIKGKTVSVSTFDNKYGSKLYIFGFDASGNVLVDFAIPTKKDQLVSNVPFAYTDVDGKVKGIFYFEGEQWGLVGTGLSVTKNENSKITGSFSGKAYQLDYSGNTAVRVDSANVTSGKFIDLKVKG